MKRLVKHKDESLYLVRYLFKNYKLALILYALIRAMCISLTFTMLVKIYSIEYLHG